MSKEEEILAAVADAVGFTPTNGLRLSYDAEGAFRVSLNGTRLDVTYAAVDPMPPAVYWGDERGTFRRFRSADAREKHVRRWIRAGAVVFDVVQSQGGRLAAADIGTATDPVAVLAFPDTLSEMVNEGHLDEVGAMIAANDLLEGFEAWSRGECFGIATDSFAVDPVEADLDYLDHSSAWSVIGPQAVARRLLAQDEPAPAAPAPSFV